MTSGAPQGPPIWLPAHAPRADPRPRGCDCGVRAPASGFLPGVLVPLHFGAAPSLGATVAFLCLIALCNGLRTSVSAGLGLAQIPGRPATMMTAQTAVTQVGYLLGALAGAVLIGSSGYASLGLALGGALIVSATLSLRVADPLQGRVARTSRRLESAPGLR